MMIYRSLVVGLLGAIALILAEQGAILDRSAAHRPQVRAHLAVPPPVPFVRSATPVGLDADGPATIVHISRQRTGDDPRAALGLGAREHVLAIDDRPVEPRGGDALRARWDAAGPGSYFELLVQGDVIRRMLVLVTP